MVSDFFTNNFTINTCKGNWEKGIIVPFINITDTVHGALAVFLLSKAARISPPLTKNWSFDGI